MFARLTLVPALLFCSAFALAETIEQPQVVVFGTAETYIAPNEMDWALTVRNEDAQLPATASRHSETVARVLTFLKGLNIDEKKLQTSRMQFGENWQYQQNRQVKVGYYASTDITFTISDLNLYEKLWMGLAAIEGVSIHAASYDHSDRIRLQNECRQKALIAARDKASALAQTLDSGIGEALLIEEQQMPEFRPYSMTANTRFDAGEAGQAQALAPGQITIKTQVRCIFRLVRVKL
ncbi:MAG: SIMPL domain-containing protein [Planctomycetaceae bacterium]|nr:SIMPL domain-containing protein [Planctomycetaceae bacterium]